MSGPGWELRSRSGREWAAWQVLESHPSPNGAVTLVCDVSLAGRYHSAAISEGEPPGPDFALEMRRLELETGRLEHLVRTLREALREPPMALRELTIECNLGALFDQSLDLSLGRRNDVLSGADPVATLRFRVGRMQGELTLVVDAAALESFTAGLEGLVGAPGRAPTNREAG